MTVTVTSKSTGAVRTDVTDGEGNYAVTNLGPGTYTVQIELAGFAPKTRDVVLGVGQSEKVEVELGVAVGAGTGHRQRRGAGARPDAPRRSASTSRRRKSRTSR